MREEQIIEEILRYIRDDAYNYAVLIDGEWGSGKTYFAKNILSDAIRKQEEENQKRSIKYISLYGCKSLSDVQENIAWSFAENARRRITEKTGGGKEKEAISGTVLTTSRKIGNAILRKFTSDISVYDIASDWLSLGAYIFIIDDLERCDCPLNEVFGFLNELVEHENTKVILVANEKEILGIAKPEHLEQQYSLTLDERIAWPKEESNNRYWTNNTAKGLSVSELERRRQLLFPTQDANTDYRKIREKLIGVTLRYSPNIIQIMTEIITASKYNASLKQVLISKLNYFKSTMDYYHHHNLRSFQFFLSKVSYLLEKYNEIQVDKEARDIIRDHIISETFNHAVKWKSNYKPPQDNRTWLSKEQESRSVIIKEYVERGEFVFELFKNDVQTLQQELRASISQDDPYNLLYQNYYLHTQRWCEEQLEKINDHLHNNKYPLSIYPKIIIAVQRLLDLGFEQKYMDQTIDAMLKNVSEMGENHPISADIWFCDDQEFVHKVQKIISEINREIESRSLKAAHENVTEMLEKPDWIDRLEKYINPNKSYYAMDIPVFSKAEVPLWINRLHEADPERIDDFRHFLEEIYPKDVRRKSYETDAEHMKSIKKEIDGIEETDLIKKACLGWLSCQFERIIHFHEPDEDSVAESNICE